MALIECPKCGCKISDRAVSCPHCGFSNNGTVIDDGKVFSEKPETKLNDESNVNNDEITKECKSFCNNVHEVEKTSSVQNEQQFFEEKNDDDRGKGEKKHNLIVKILIGIIVVMGIAIVLLIVQRNQKTENNAQRDGETKSRENTVATETEDKELKDNIVESVKVEDNAEIKSSSESNRINDEVVNDVLSGEPGQKIVEIKKFEETQFDNVYGEGTYKVGTDIPAGRYVGFGPQRWTGTASIYTTADKKEPINEGNNWGNHFMFISIEEGQYLDLYDFFVVPIDELEEKGLENFGIYIVGETLEAGEYQLQPVASDAKGFVKTYSDFTEESGIVQEYFPATLYKTFRNGEIVVLQNASAIVPLQEKNVTTQSSNDKFDTIYTSAMYRVGTDIDAGTYVAYGPQKWTTSVDISSKNTSDATVDYYYFNCILIINTQPGQYVDVKDEAYLVPYSLIEELSPDITGVYVVGKDIDAGEYKLIASQDDNSHYWACYSSELIMEGNNSYKYFDNQDYVSLEEGEVFTLMNATYEKQ